MKLFSISILFLLILSGCSTKNNPHFSKKISHTKYIPKSKNSITQALYKEYKKWYKTPYKYGGINLTGVDCSALVQSVYKDAFGIKIPRTTIKQIVFGEKIARSELREGDLVFFKTGYKVRHAGIIIEADKFMHASVKYGVTISSIYNPYWRSRYLQSRRVLP